jgi:hypothetical protein
MKVDGALPGGVVCPSFAIHHFHFSLFFICPALSFLSLFVLSSFLCDSCISTASFEVPSVFDCLRDFFQSFW